MACLGAFSCRLKAVADRTEFRADDSDLPFDSIELADENGVLVTSEDRKIRVEVGGAGILQALGRSRPATEEATSRTHTPPSMDAPLVIVRPTRRGKITFTAVAEGIEPIILTLSAEEHQT
ncbi:hypothetical protein [Sinomonas humi]|uniref:hypothetical protein n=1 Tax=Sinomonas humi TaxID=1338436 RepID=UPI0018CD444A